MVRTATTGYWSLRLGTFEMVASVILGEDPLRKPSIITMVEGPSLIRLRAFKLVNSSVESSSVYKGTLTRPGTS